MRTRVRFFISYAHDDQPLPDDLVLRLRKQMVPSRGYEHELWHDRGILVGERWAEEIDNALKECQVGILLLSPSFLGSGFIGRVELPRFVGDAAKPVIPVMLRPVNLQRHDLKGVEEYQIYRLDGKKTFDQLKGDRHRNRFAEGLFEQIEQRLDRLGGKGPHA
jgi:hypothetical protein